MGEDTQQPFQHLVGSPALGNKSPAMSYIHGLPNPPDSCRRKHNFMQRYAEKTDSGSVPLFLWTPHRLVAVDGVDTFHPGFGLLFVAVENQIQEEDLCVVPKKTLARREQ